MTTTKFREHKTNILFKKITIFTLVFSLSALIFPAFSENKSSVTPIKSEKITPLILDPNAPVIPLMVDRPLTLEKDLSAEDANAYLQNLLEAQAKLIHHVKVLQARIERTEARSAANTNKIKGNIQENRVQNATLNSIAQRTTVSGYAEMGGRVFSNAPLTGEFLGAKGDGNLFDLRRVNLRTNVQFTKKASWYAEVEYEDAGADFVGLEESAFTYAHRPWLNVRSGLMLPNLTWTNVNHDGPSRLLVDRPLVDQLVIPSTYRDLGVGIYGTLPISKKRPIKYDLMVLNGFTDLISSGQRTGMPVASSPSFKGLRNLRPHRTANNKHLRDNNDNKAIFGRIDVQPIKNMNIGIASLFQKYDVRSSKDLWLLSGDFRYKVKRFSLLAEFANANFERGKGMNSQGIRFTQFPSNVRGYYVQAAYDLSKKMKGILAYNAVNLDSSLAGTTYRRMSAGVRYNLYKQVFLKGEYQATLSPSRFKDKHMSNALLTQLTFSF